MTKHAPTTTADPAPRWRLGRGGLALLATWIAIAAVIISVSVSTRDHFALVGSLGLRGKPAASTPLTAAYLPGNVDGRVWFRFVSDPADGKVFRLRHTNIDNAPTGREVHWSSGWRWAIAGSGTIARVLTGKTALSALELGTFWFSPLVLIVVIVGLSSYVATRLGWMGGVLVAVAMAGHTTFFENFYPTYLDHHGIIATAVFAMIMAATFMGAGYWSPGGDDSGFHPVSRTLARRAAMISGIGGGIALWLSASSAIPAIAFTGLAGIACVAVGRNHHASLQFEPAVWRTWGRAGAITSLAFYILEYFPNHLGVRLEVNHPLYALAWLGAGELIAEIGIRLSAAPGAARGTPERIVRPALAILLAPLVMLFGGTAVFALRDPFLADLHTQYIREFSTGWPGFDGLGITDLPLAAGLVYLAVKRMSAPPLVWFATLLAAACTGMGWMQYRWLDVASGPQILLALVLVRNIVSGHSEAFRMKLAFGIFGVAFVPPIVTGLVAARAQASEQQVTSVQGMLMVYRDVAAAIRGSQPTGDITLLTTPTIAPHIAHFGQFRTIGTFYWENGEGLRANAEILSATSEAEAEAMIRARGITHIALLSSDDFVSPLFKLLHPGASDSAVALSFGSRLLHQGRAPRWLQWIPYRLPEDLASLGVRVLLFKVAFDQSEADALIFSARAKIELGEFVSADAEIRRLIELRPDGFMPRMLLGQALFAQKQWAQAADAAEDAITRAPADQRVAIARSVGNNFFAAGQIAYGIKLLRTAIRIAFDPDAACSLAFTLATTTADSIRNGREALDLAQRAVRADSGSVRFQICLSVALAETGRFDDALIAVTKSKSLAASSRDADAGYIASQLETSFLAHKPWRN